MGGEIKVESSKSRTDFTFKIPYEIAKKRVLQNKVQWLMKISQIRSILYKTAKYLGDFDSIGKKRVGKRVANRIAGKVTGRTLFRWINKLFMHWFTHIKISLLYFIYWSSSKFDISTNSPL